MSITSYSSKHDISYSKFNASNIPWNINTSYIYQNNLNTRNVSQYFQNINNNLLFESSTNNIIFITPQNKNVIVKNNMVIHNNLDISNNLNTSLTRANDISVNNVLYLTTISGTLKVQGGIFINSNKQDKEASKTRFTGIVLYGTVIIFDCSIVDCDNIITTDISESSIINSYIYNSPIGYDKYNNIYPNNAIFSDVILNNLIFDSSLNNNRLSFIRFNNNSNSNSITISSSNDFSNLEISKPLLVEQQETNTNIINVSNISIFNGDISCNTLYYSRLNPDIKLNTYFDVSVSAVSLSGSIIPTRSTNINLGSNTYKFSNIYSDKFTGVLDGSSTIALNLVPNLSMSFNNLNITGALTLNGLNLNQNLLTNFVTISNVNISFGAITSNISDLSLNLNSRITILRNNITLSFGDVSSNIRTICGTLISISNDIFYTKTSFDTSLNRNFIKYTDLSTAIMVNPDAIYKSIGYLDNALNKQISVTLSNELLFPYAITYIDDNVEDTNIRERYKIRQTRYKQTTTLTNAYTVKTTRTFKTTPTDIYSTVGIEPDNANHNYLVMDNIISMSDMTVRRKWYDTNGSGSLPAIFRKTVAAVAGGTTTTFELRTNADSWTDHKGLAEHSSNDTNVTYSLAVIRNATDNTTIKNLLTSTFNIAWIGARRKKNWAYTELYDPDPALSATFSNGYIVLTYSHQNGTSWFKPKFTGTVEVLLVGGGGSGGSNAGGGGGGGAVLKLNVKVFPGTYGINVGAGGIPGYSGSNTTAFNATARGGGKGGDGPSSFTVRSNSNGTNGGSGGGGGARFNIGGNIDGGGVTASALGTSAGEPNTGSIHDNSGASPYPTNGTVNNNLTYSGGGGGGAGRAANNYDGGAGIDSDITGTASYYGGGGGGGGSYWYSGPAPNNPAFGRALGYGGSGGGGNGGNSSFLSSGLLGKGSNGTNGTGGGGGGGRAVISWYNTASVALSGSAGGSGGHGVVIIRFKPDIQGWPGRGSAYWEWINGDPWDNYTNWAPNEPGMDESYAVMLTDGYWYDINDNNIPAVYMKKVVTQPVQPSDTYYFDSNSPRTMAEHITWASNNSTNGTTYKLAGIYDNNANEEIATLAYNANKPTIYIGAQRNTNSNATGTSGRTESTWYWQDGTNWSYTNFYDGYLAKTSTTYSTKYTQGSPGAPANTNNLNGTLASNTPARAYFSHIDIDQTNVKLPCLVSSSNGSIVVTSTAIGVNSRPTPQSDERVPNSGSIAVSGFGPNDANIIGTTIGATVNSRVVNTIELSTYQINTTGATRIGNTDEYLLSSITNNAYPNDTQDHYEYKRFEKYTFDTYSYAYDYITDNGLTTGSFKISDNSSNYSYYRTAAITPPAISTAYVCIAITNDGMFVALGKASNVTVYMKVSNGWTSLGYIGVDFSTYTNSNMIPTQLPADFRKNIQNLAINYIAPRLFIAYGDNKTSIKVYRYTIAGQSWTPIGQPRTHNPTTQLSNPTNFGYFVVLSSSPSILGFTVDDKFHTYNCSGDSDNSIRGSIKTLTQPSTYSVDRNIIAFKISSDADKIIVSNTSYVFIYKWNTTTNDWNVPTVIDYASANITFDYGTIKNIRAWPRSLDISNISSNECVFAVGFPDKHIYSPTSTLSRPTTPSKARGYVEYWKLSNTTLTKLATLFPRMRDITTNTPGDIDEYFFSAGGIKITNSNTILVAPNYKFHFNSTNKSYSMSGITDTHQGHFGRGSLAAIENEVENELIRFSARNFQGASYYIGGRRITPSNWHWWTPESPSPFIWNFEAWDNNQPNVNDRAAVEVNTLTRRWSSLSNANQKNAMYMTIMPSYSLNTFSIFNNKFFFHSSGFYSSYSTTTQSDTTTIIARWKYANNDHIRFLANGDVNQSNNNRTTFSDIRLKENIVDTRPKLQDLLKIRVVNYNLKGNKGNKLIGVVAQELEDIFPLLVGKQELSQEDIKLGKTETYKYVKYSCFDVMLIKAIQEQQAIISNLTSQLDLIDNKCKILKTIAQDVVILNQDRDFLICENELLKISINKILELMKKGTK
jgi:hypothetical protein